MNFLLFAPDFWQGSAGVRALYLLGEYLIDLGHGVTLWNYQSSNPPPPWCRLKLDRSSFEPDVVCIMPETIDFTVADARVIRWCLNFPGKLGGPSMYTSNEFVVHWDNPGAAPLCAAAAHNGISHELTLGLVDVGTDPCIARVHNFYYEGKTPSDGSHPAHLTLLPRGQAGSLVELRHLLHATATMYTYDLMTQTSFEAHLCGVKVFERQPSGWEPYRLAENHEKFLTNPARDKINISAILDLFNRSR